MFYNPQLPDGRPAPMPWPIKHLCWNLTAWPLADSAPKWLRPAVLFYTLCCFGLLSFLHYSNFYYVYIKFPNVADILAIIPTYLAMLEMHIRSFHMASQKQQLKGYLTKFYLRIYMEKSQHPEIFSTIRFKTLPTIYFSVCYVFTYLFFINDIVLGWIRGELNLMFKQAFPYDVTPMERYLPHMALNCWVGQMTIAQLFGESNILATCVLHLNGRYQLLQQDMQSFVDQLMQSNTDSANIAKQFEGGLLKFIRRAAELNQFVTELEDIFTFRIFVLFSLSSIGFCTLLYNIFINGLSWQNAQLLCWLFGKTCELFVIGELGSTLINTTDTLSGIFYQSGWHDIVLHSSDRRENVRLMKLVLLAMQVNCRPLSLTGLRFFAVSLSTVLSILQGAISYFTFLNAMG